MRRFRRFFPLLAAVAALAFASPARAADPIGSIVSYQGLLSDNAGKPVADGNQSLTFTIYADGASVFTATQDVATAKGVFNAFVNIGALTFDPAKSLQNRRWQARFTGVVADHGHSS